MREVTLRWTGDALAGTNLDELNEVVERLRIVGHLLVSPEGVRQIVLPTFKEGKEVEDLANVSFLTVEQRVNDRDSQALVVWNEHPVVRLASQTTNIHVVAPYEFRNGGITVTVRGLPQAVSTFVKMSKAILPPAEVKVTDLLEQNDPLLSALTQRQRQCFALAHQYGFYEEPKQITVQALAATMELARSTFQEHLTSAEQAILRWVGSTLEPMEDETNLS